MQTLVDRIDAPAYCADATTVLAGNRLAGTAFGDYVAQPPARPNLLRLLLTDRRFAQRLVERDDAARLVRTFRDRSEAPLADPVVIALVTEPRERCPDSRQLWDSREPRRAGTDTPRVHHPDGPRTFTVITFQDLGPTGVRITAYLPSDSTVYSELSGRAPMVRTIVR